MLTRSGGYVNFICDLVFNPVIAFGHTLMRGFDVAAGFPERR